MLWCVARDGRFWEARIRLDRTVLAARPFQACFWVDKSAALVGRPMLAGILARDAETLPVAIAVTNQGFIA